MEPRVREQLERLFPRLRLIGLEPLAPDTGATAGATHKAAGYGLPVRAELVDEAGVRRELVWRTASANEFGHDRRADRAGDAVLAFDTFGKMPQHVEAIDLGVVRADGELMSIRDGVEPYLITTYARGTIYADDLRRIAVDGRARDRDVARVTALAAYLARLHEPIPDGMARYRRALRDMIGSGEGIFGIVDGYPRDVPGAPPARLRALEERCATWRWRLHERGDRLVRTHGDYHPFNVVFGDDDTLTLLDASRGGCGDAADDLTAMAINFLLFAVDTPAAWRDGYGVLWRRFWAHYLAARDDHDLFAVAPAFLAWRALVVCNPRFYPRLGEHARDQLLGYAERALAAGVLAPETAEELFS